MAKSKAVVKKEESTAVQNIDYGEDAGSGFENQTQDDVQIPFIGVLQPMSPQVEVGGDAQLEGASPGMLHNTVTDDLYKGSDGFEFIPCFTKQWFVEWIPRTAGGGFVGKYEVNAEIVAKARAESTEFGKYKTPDGNDLVQTFEVWGILVTAEGDIEPVILSFTSTKITVYKKWNTKIQMFTLPKKDGKKIRPPLFAHRVRVTTVKQSNVHGTFYNFVLSPTEGEIKSSLLEPSDPKFAAAKSLRQMISSGAVKAADDSQREGNANDSAEPGSGGSQLDEAGEPVF